MYRLLRPRTLLYVAFERPTIDGADSAVAITPSEPGIHRGRFELPLTSTWNGHVTIRRGEEPFVHEQRLVLP